LISPIVRYAAPASAEATKKVTTSMARKAPSAARLGNDHPGHARVANALSVYARTRRERDLQARSSARASVLRLRQLNLAAGGAAWNYPHG
jgi:hypothetical protein